MNKYIQEWLKDIGVNYGERINCLVDANVLTRDYIVREAIESKDSVIMYHTALRLKGITIKHVEKLAEAIIKEKNLEIMCIYASYISGAPTEKLADEIIKSENGYYIVKFASEVKEAPIRKLEKAIIKTNDAKQIYRYALNVINNDPVYDANTVERLTNAITQTENAEYIYLFAKNIFGAPINKLSEAIIKTKNEEYIEKFRNLPNIPKYFDMLKERLELEELSEEDKIQNLINDIRFKNIDSIRYNADIYRKLFVDNEEELKELEENKYKKRVRAPQQSSTIRREQTKPQFPGISKKD